MNPRYANGNNNGWSGWLRPTRLAASLIWAARRPIHNARGSQAHSEDTPAVWLALDRDCATYDLDQPATDGQAESPSLVGVVFRIT